MRWNEIVTEDLGIVQTAKGYIMDIIATLKAQGVEVVTVQQIIDQISQTPELEGFDVDASLINQALKGVEGLNVKPNPETGQMSVFIDNPTAGRQVDQKQAERDDKAIKSAALRTIDRKDKE